MRLAFALIAAVTAGSPAAADCLPWGESLEALLKNHNEQPRMIAVRSDGGLLVITVSPEGAWSALTVSPDGTGCMAAWGEGIQFEPPGSDM